MIQEGATVCKSYNAGREFDVVMVAESEGGYSVFVPDLPSVATQGETIEEARANAQEAIEGLSGGHARRRSTDSLGAS
jgi:predicted RNase H-like HicB family nuclease